jgi:hypothetical protein
MRYWVLTLLLNLSATAVAASAHTLRYDVIAFGTHIGESRQKLDCKASGACKLQAETFPTGLARLFTQEQLYETSRFSRSPQPAWQRYEKKKYENGRLVRTVTLEHRGEHIVYLEKQRRFPAKDPVFDALSLPFVLHLWKQPPASLYLQDDNWQDALRSAVWKKNVQLNEQAVHFYHLKGTHVDIQVWLDPQSGIPVQLIVHNLDRNRRITLKQIMDTDHAPE